MYEYDIHEFKVVPFSTVASNGMYLSHLNSDDMTYEGHVALISPNGKAVSDGHQRPYCFRSVVEAIADVSKLTVRNGS